MCFPVLLEACRSRLAISQPRKGKSSGCIISDQRDTERIWTHLKWKLVRCIDSEIKVSGMVWERILRYLPLSASFPCARCEYQCLPLAWVKLAGPFCWANKNPWAWGAYEWSKVLNGNPGLNLAQLEPNLWLCGKLKVHSSIKLSLFLILAKWMLAILAVWKYEPSLAFVPSPLGFSRSQIGWVAAQPGLVSAHSELSRACPAVRRSPPRGRSRGLGTCPSEAKAAFGIQDLVTSPAQCAPCNCNTVYFSLESSSQQLCPSKLKFFCSSLAAGRA